MTCEQGECDCATCVNCLRPHHEHTWDDTPGWEDEDGYPAEGWWVCPDNGPEGGPVE